MRKKFRQQLRTYLSRKKLRNISAQHIEDQLWSQIIAFDDYESGLDFWPVDLYFDTDTKEPYMLVVSRGRLYRCQLLFEQAGEVIMGEPHEVEVYHEFSAQNTEQTRTAVLGKHRFTQLHDRGDGCYGGLCAMGMAVINRDGEIDTTELYHNLTQRFIGDGREYVNFYHHKGNVSRLGTVTKLVPIDRTLYGYTLFDDDAIAIAAAHTLANDDTGEWGGSIEYDPLGDIEQLEVARGIEIDAYNDGVFLGYTICKERHAASFGTENMIMKRTSVQSDEKYWQLAFDLLQDEALADDFVARDEARNARVEGAISRTTDEVDDPDDENDTDLNEQEMGAEDFIVDDDLMDELVERVFADDRIQTDIIEAIFTDERMQPQQRTTDPEQTEELMAQLAQMREELAQMRTQVNRTQEDEMDDLLERMPPQPKRRRARRPSNRGHEGRQRTSGSSSAQAARMLAKRQGVIDAN